MLNANPKDISIWMADLAVRVSPTMTSEQVEVLSRDFATGLSDLPADVFCGSAREAAARTFDRFPTYKRLRKFLEDWWSEQKPATALPALPGPEDPSLDHRDRVMVGIILRDKAKAHSLDQLTKSLSIIRNTHTRAFQYLCLTDAGIRDFASRHGWWMDPEDRADPDEVSKLTTEVTRHFRSQPPDDLPHRPDAVLTPEQLRATRAAAGINLPDPERPKPKLVEPEDEPVPEPWVPPWEREAV